MSTQAREDWRQVAQAQFGRAAALLDGVQTSHPRPDSPEILWIVRPDEPETLAAAQVHATLALAAATLAYADEETHRWPMAEGRPS